MFLVAAFAHNTAAYTSTQIPPTPQEFAVQMADEYGLNTEHFLATIRCESGWDNVQSKHLQRQKLPKGYVSQGDPLREQSFGVVQINLPSNDVTLEQALDPYWSVKFMAREWSKGKHRKWSCWKLLYS